MSSFIETLNYWGGQALDFAWPMLWQSSLLIVLVFALDLLFARKIRASVRHALWLAVLVKLLLPPALALPTGVAWWLFPAHQAPVAPVTKYEVTYDPSPLATELVPQAIPPKIAPRLNGAGWVLVGSITASAALLFWLGFRWWQVARLVRSAVEGEEFSVLVDEACYLAGLRGAVRLKLVADRMSPAVCGLFRPVILLPRALAEKLSPAQLRAVLLHEMVHLRRFDVWMNCAQALLQIIYWWHPLLWVANARIRRVREEAVDDAVMLALCEEADGYAPTLLEVAKLALRRPLVSLGLVGIMESRSALRQRVERLINFQAPRKAGLTFASFCGIFVFSAVALPMGQAPVTDNDADLPQVGAASPAALQSLTLKVDPEIFLRNEAKLGSNSLIATAGGYPYRMAYGLADVLHSVGIDCIPRSGVKFNVKTGEITIQNTPEQLEIFRQVIGQLNRADGIFDSRMIAFHRKSVLIEARFFWMQSADLDKLTPTLDFHPGQNGLSYDWTIAAGKFNDLDQRIKSLGLTPFMRPRVLTGHGIPAQMFCGTKINGVEFDCCPLVIPGGIQLAFKTEVVGLPAGGDQGLTGTTRFNLRGMDATEDHGGMVLRADDPNGSSSNLVMVLKVQVVTNESHYAQRLQPILKPGPGGQVAQANGKTSQSLGSDPTAVTTSNSNSPALALIQPGQDVEWTGNRAVLSVKTREGNAIKGIRLVTRSTTGPDAVTTADTGEVEAGLDDDSVWLTLYEAKTDHGKVHSEMEKYRMLLTGYTKPQIHIKARFIEVAKGATVDLDRILAWTNSADGKAEGFLNAANARNALRSLESQNGFDVLAEPEVTLLSGRQVQMRATSMVTVVTNLAFQEVGTNKSVVAQTGQVETGPIIDAVPRIMADGYTLNIKITASVIDFLGYDKSTNTWVYDRAGEKIDLATVAPRFSVQSTSTTVNVLDDHTVVFALGTSADYSALARLVGITDPKSMVARLKDGGLGGSSSKEPDKQILVFVTTTLVDSVGNRLHSDDELAVLSGRVVPQPIQ